MNIEELIDINYLTENRNNRRGTGLNKTNKNTQEYFTPASIIRKMCNLIPEEDWRDPNKTFLESSCGNGNFLLMIIFCRINSGINWKITLETLFAIDLMQDNIQEARQRVHELLRNISPDYDPKVADEIMDKNFVCSDFFKWDFENWCPLKQPKKKNEGDNGQLLFKFYNNKSIVKEPTPKQKFSKQHKQKSTPNAKQLPIDFN